MNKKTSLLVSLFAFIVIVSLSCSQKIKLGTGKDYTPPELVLTVNGVPLKDSGETNKFERQHINRSIRLNGTARDEESGVHHVDVGANLTYMCGESDEEKIYSTYGDKYRRVYPKSKTGDKVARSHSATSNFKLQTLQNDCGRKPLLNVEGEVFVSAINYSGKTSKKSYRVEFIPTQ